MNSMRPGAKDSHLLFFENVSEKKDDIFMAFVLAN
tara:strand:+ start:29 stop:133 length:105 start_codon:yes stop_codon:yes gene_type:complete